MASTKISQRKKRMFRAKRDSMQEIALQRMGTLLNEAESVFNSNPALANRYVALARRLSAKFKVQFSKEQKLRFCRNCGAYLKHGKNSRIRLSGTNIVIKCSACGYIRRSRYK